MQFQVMHKYLLEMVFIDWSQLKGMHRYFKRNLKESGYMFCEDTTIYLFHGMRKSCKILVVMTADHDLDHLY